MQNAAIAGAYGLPLGRSQTAQSLLICTAMAALALAARCLDLQSSDVGWLLSCAEWMLDGRRMGVDFFETNPPGAVLIYWPAAALGRLTGLGADWTNEILLLALGGLAIAYTARRLIESRNSAQNAASIVTILIAALLIVPSHAFGQREHFGVLFLMPWLAQAATRNVSISISMQLIGGLGIALACLAKPHCLIVPAAVQLVEFARARSWRTLINLQNVLAGFLISAYAAAIVAFFPEYAATILPRVLEVYHPLQRDFGDLAMRPGVMLWLAMALLGLVLRNPESQNRHAADTFLLAALAGGILYFSQRKGFYYHMYPGFACAMIAAFLYALDAPEKYRTRTLNAGIACSFIVFSMGGYQYFGTPNAAHIRALARAVASLDPAPRILALTSDIETGFPVTRMAGGEWVQRPPFLWMATGAITLRRRAGKAVTERHRLFDFYEALERKTLAEDITRGKPTIVLALALQGKDWLAWALEDPELARLLASYETAAIVGPIKILKLRNSAKLQ